MPAFPMLSDAAVDYLSSVIGALRRSSAEECAELVVYSVQFGRATGRDESRTREFMANSRLAKAPLQSPRLLRLLHGDCFFRFRLAEERGRAVNGSAARVRSAGEREGEERSELYRDVLLDPRMLPFRGAQMRRNVKIFKMLGASIFPWTQRLLWIDGKVRPGETDPRSIFAQNVDTHGASLAAGRPLPPPSL